MSAPLKSGGVENIKANVPPLTSSEKKMSKEEKERYGIENEGLRQNQLLQKMYARRTFKLCCAWVCAVFVLVMFQGFGSYRHFRFYLSERVILALIGSTTANIIGVFLIVVRFIFHDKDAEANSN